MSTRSAIGGVAAIAACLLLVSATGSPGGAAENRAGQRGTGIDKIVVVVEQDHTFDSYFGSYPGVNGLDRAVPPVAADGSGARVGFLPYDEAEAESLRPPSGESPLDNSSATARRAADGGAMDGFLLAQQEAGHRGDASVLLHTASSAAPLWSVARQAVLFDDYYSAELGGSLTNMTAMLTGSSVPLEDGSKASLRTLAAATPDTVFDRLQRADWTWKYYVGGFADVDPAKAADGSYLRDDVAAPAPLYRVPVLAMPRFWTNPDLRAGLTSQEAFYLDAAAGLLPDVSFVSPSPSDHPASSSAFAQTRLLSLLNALAGSPDWPHLAVFVVWDDWGGYFDHVPPPDGRGFRVPLLLLSPWAERGVVSSVEHDHLSILNFIVRRFGLPSLTARQSSSEGFDDVLLSQPRKERPAFTMRQLATSPVGTTRQNNSTRLLYLAGLGATLCFASAAWRRWDPNRLARRKAQRAGADGGGRRAGPVGVMLRSAQRLLR